MQLLVQSLVVCYCRPQRTRQFAAGCFSCFCDLSLHEDCESSSDQQHLQRPLQREWLIGRLCVAYRCWQRVTCTNLGQTIVAEFMQHLQAAVLLLLMLNSGDSVHSTLPLLVLLPGSLLLPKCLLVVNNQQTRHFPPRACMLACATQVNCALAASQTWQGSSHGAVGLTSCSRRLDSESLCCGPRLEPIRPPWPTVLWLDAGCSAADLHHA